VLIDGMLGGFDDVRTTAAAGEAAGYAGLWTGETMHDPFLQIVQAAEVTERVTLGTSIAIAFGRTPMTLATTSYDLARYTRGRFVLGLGSQVKPHIERRFSMPWSHPAPRMREFVSALRAIWACWQDGTKLDFRGDFYTHTLMTPFFSPPAHEWGPPPVYLAGVGPLMTEVAGEVCDGFFFHGFTTPSYLREITLPALARGRAAGGHGTLGEATMDGFDIAGPAFTCVADTEEGLADAIRGAKQQIAFYASTPAYRGVLDHHGWGDLQPELTRLSKEGKWEEMGDLIDDDMVRTFAAVGDVATVARELRERWDGVATRLSFYAPYKFDAELRRTLLAELSEAELS
jgi:probable F420-dependent oxidoreductase